MTKKQIKQLANFSFSKDLLDGKKVNRVSKLLTRNELKIYIKALKNIENSKKVTLVTPNIKGMGEIVSKLKSLFPDKRIELKEDKTLLAGVKIIDNDNIYDYNLKNTLKNLVGFINQ